MGSQKDNHDSMIRFNNKSRYSRWYFILGQRFVYYTHQIASHAASCLAYLLPCWCRVVCPVGVPPISSQWDLHWFPGKKLVKPAWFPMVSTISKSHPAIHVQTSSLFPSITITVLLPPSIISIFLSTYLSLHASRFLLSTYPSIHALSFISTHLPTYLPTYLCTNLSI